MPVPSNNATASSVNGTLVAATLTLANNDRQARVVLSGTYTGVTGTIDVSMDGTTWINRQAVQEDTGALVSGTISVSAANLSYVVDCDGWMKVRFNCTACASGTCVQTVYASNTLVSGTNPIVANTSSQTSFTNGTFSGTLGVTGATTLSSTLAVTSGATLSSTLGVTGATTLSSTLAVTGAATLSSTLSCTALTATSIAGTGTVALTDNMTITDAKNIVLNTTTGTKIGTGTTQKLAFYNSTPIVQPANTVDYLAALVNLGLRASGGTAPAAFPGLITSSSATGGIGYATGAGGAVTQTGSRTTTVVTNTVCGAITLVSAAGSATAASFTVTNSTVAVTDTIIVSQKSGTDKYVILVTAVGSGSFQITFYTTGGTTTEQPVFNFSVIKAVAA